MIERGDHVVFDEPFSRHYYFGPEKRSPRFADVLPDSRPDEIVTALEAAARDAPVFAKDMAYHVDAIASPELVGRFVNAFLIRDPAYALPSLAARWPDFTDEESGYAALARLVALADGLGQDAPIIDSDDLCRDPSGMVRAYCARVGIPFAPESLEWEPGMRPEWELWPDWYQATAASSGFNPPSADPPPARTDPHLTRAYERCAPIYEQLRARRLRPA